MKTGTASPLAGLIAVTPSNFTPDLSLFKSVLSKSDLALVFLIYPSTSAQLLIADCTLLISGFSGAKTT